MTRFVFLGFFILGLIAPSCVTGSGVGRDEQENESSTAEVPSATATATATVSPTATVTPAPSNTPTATASPTPAPGPTRTGIPTATPAADLTCSSAGDLVDEMPAAADFVPFDVSAYLQRRPYGVDWPHFVVKHPAEWQAEWFSDSGQIGLVMTTGDPLASFFEGLAEGATVWVMPSFYFGEELPDSFLMPSSSSDLEILEGPENLEVNGFPAKRAVFSDEESFIINIVLLCGTEILNISAMTPVEKSAEYRPTLEAIISTIAFREVDSFSYQMTFTDPGDWIPESNATFEGHIANGVYNFIVDEPDTIFWTLVGRSFGAGTYAVDVTQTEGPENAAYGLVFGLRDSGMTFYLFGVSTNGFIWAIRCDDGCNDIEMLLGTGRIESALVARGLDQLHRLAVDVAETGDMTFYLNGTEIGRATDSGWMSGDLGMFVGTSAAEGPVVVQFDNLTFTPKP